MSERRNKLRARALGSKPQFRSETIQGYEIRQPSLRSRSETFKLATDSEGNVDSEKLMIAVLTNNVFVPDTDDLIFEVGDVEILMSQPAGGLIDELGQAALRLFNLDIETARKN